MKIPINRNPAFFCQPSSAFPVARSLIVLAVLSAASGVAQNPPTTPSNFTEGTRIYAQQCAGCLGADANGTDKASGLVGILGFRDRSLYDLRNLFSKMIPC